MKLTIELIPSSCFFSNLRSELKKSEWDKIRKQCYALANNKCQICGGKGYRHAVEAHEVWQFDIDTKTQKLVDIVALCPSCHQVKHFGRAEIIGKRDEAIKHWMKINNLTITDFNLYLEAVTEEWLQRSNVEWVLDVNFLQTY